MKTSDEESDSDFLEGGGCDAHRSRHRRRAGGGPCSPSKKIFSSSSSFSSLQQHFFSFFLSLPARSADDVVVPNENLVADGLPAIPKSLAERVAPYTESRGATFEAWHPVRREMLIGTRFGDVAQIHRVKFPGGGAHAAHVLPRAHGRRAVPARSRADGFVFNKDVGGGEWFQLFWRDEKTGKVTMFTDGKSRNTGGDFSRSGKWLAYQSTRRNGKDNDIWVVDPADPKTERKVLEVAGGGWGVSDWSPDDKTLLVGEYLSANESRYWLVDVATGAKTPRDARGEGEGRLGPRRLREGRQVALHDDGLGRGVPPPRVARPRVEEDHGPDARHRRGTCPRSSLSEDGGKLAFVVNEGGVETLHVLDTATRKEIALPKTPARDDRRRALPRERKGPRLLAVLGAVGVGRVLDRRHAGPAGKVERWTESETGRARRRGASRSPRRSRGRASTAGRSRASSTGRRRRFTGPRPVIVNIHGGPEGQYQPGFLGRSNFYMNELGVAVIYPNVRGSTGFGKTFLKLDNGEKREDSVKDIGALLDWIAAQPDLDKSRVMVDGRLLRRLHDARLDDALQRPLPLRRRRRGDLELRDVPREHRGLPARPAARRVRRRARPEDAGVPPADLAAHERRRRSRSRCSSSRAATTRACRTPRPSRWSRRSRRTAGPSGTSSRRTRATASPRRRTRTSSSSRR